MTDWLNVFTYMQALGFQPQDFEYVGQQIIATTKFAYTPKIGDYVVVSTTPTAAGPVLWAYTSDPTHAAGEVIGSEVRKGDFRNQVWYRVSLTLQPGQMFLE